MSSFKDEVFSTNYEYPDQTQDGMKAILESLHSSAVSRLARICFPSVRGRVSAMARKADLVKLLNIGGDGSVDPPRLSETTGESLDCSYKEDESVAPVRITPAVYTKPGTGVGYNLFVVYGKAVGDGWRDPYPVAVVSEDGRSVMTVREFLKAIGDSTARHYGDNTYGENPVGDATSIFDAANVAFVHRGITTVSPSNVPSGHLAILIDSDAEGYHYVNLDDLVEDQGKDGSEPEAPEAESKAEPEPVSDDDDVVKRFSPDVVSKAGSILDAAIEQGMSEALAKLVEKAATKVAVQPQGETVIADGEVTYQGHGMTLVMPQIGDPGETEPDEHFNPKMWRARTEVGNLAFEYGLNDVAQDIVSDKNVWLWGPPSVGKTAAIHWLGEICGWPVVRIQMTRDTSLIDLVGCRDAADGSTSFTYGPLPQAMKVGALTIIDEIDHAPGEVTSMLHSVLEGRRTLSIASNGGEVIKAHPNFRVVATANTAGKGDQTGSHGAAMVQDTALSSRFATSYEVTWPDESSEAAMIQARTGIAGEDATRIVDTASGTRQAYDNGSLVEPVGVRGTMAWADSLANGQTIARAFVSSCVAMADPADRATLGEIAQRALGDDWQADRR